MVSSDHTNPLLFKGFRIPLTSIFCEMLEFWHFEDVWRLFDRVCFANAENRSNPKARRTHRPIPRISRHVNARCCPRRADDVMLLLLPVCWRRPYWSAVYAFYWSTVVRSGWTSRCTEFAQETVPFPGHLAFYKIHWTWLFWQISLFTQTADAVGLFLDSAYSFFEVLLECIYSCTLFKFITA